mmetsp:Transcript_7865/g.11850  ORF Transcript_7865/g.11850 Transcript_7865/m.11850 type:complete len:96 (-) Transcript_7865:146-433(-)
MLEIWQQPPLVVDVIAMGLICCVRGIWCAIWKDEMLLQSDRTRTDRIKFLREHLVYLHLHLHLHIFCWLLLAGPVDTGDKSFRFSILNVGLAWLG